MSEREHDHDDLLWSESADLVALMDELGSCSASRSPPLRSIKNDVDNCPTIANPAQTDGNGDSVGDACDPLAGFNPLHAVRGGAGFVSLVPGRLMDSRAGQATFDGLFAGAGVAAAGSVTELDVTGRAAVPDDAGSVVVNVTAVDARAPGYVTAYPCGSPTPNASNVNYTTGDTIPNAVIAKIGDGGNVCLYTSSPTDLVIDVNGYHLRSS